MPQNVVLKKEIPTFKNKFSCLISYRNSCNFYTSDKAAELGCTPN